MDEHPAFTCAGGPQEAVHQPDVARGGGEGWSELWCLSSHHRCLGGGTNFHLVATAASPLFSSGSFLYFLSLSPCGRAWRYEVFGTRDCPYESSPSMKLRVPDWELREVGEGAQGKAVVTQGQAIMQQHRAQQRCQIPGNLELIS